MKTKPVDVNAILSDPDRAPGHAWRAVPRPSPVVESRKGKSGRLYLKKRVDPSMLTERWFSRKFRLRRDRKFRLDSAARHFWELVDGHRDLGQIEKQMRNDFGWNSRESRRGVLQYTAVLMERGLLVLTPADAEGDTLP
jgi:hypothetical protein